MNNLSLFDRYALDLAHAYPPLPTWVHRYRSPSPLPRLSIIQPVLVGRPRWLTRSVVFFSAHRAPYLLPPQAAPQFSSDVKTCYVLRLIVARVQMEQSHSLRSDRTSHQICSMSFWVRGPSLSTGTPGIQGICPIGRINFSCGLEAACGDAADSVGVAVRPDLLDVGD